MTDFVHTSDLPTIGWVTGLILSILIALPLGVHSSDCKQIQLKTDSVKTLLQSFAPEYPDFYDFDNGIFGWISRKDMEKEASLNIIDHDGNILYSKDCSWRAYNIDIFDNGQKALVSYRLSEFLYEHEIIDLSVKHLIRTFRTKSLIKPSEKGSYFCSVFDIASSLGPEIYDSIGQKLASLPYRSDFWPMTPLGDSSFLLLDANVLRQYSCPGMEIIFEKTLNQLNTESFMRNIATSPDGNFCAVYNSDSIVVLDLVNDRQYVLPGTHPEILVGDLILLSNNGRYLSDITYTDTPSHPWIKVYNLTSDGYKLGLSISNLPIAYKIINPAQSNCYLYNDMLLTYFHSWPMADRPYMEYYSALIRLDQGTSGANPYFFTNNILVPYMDGGDLNCLGMVFGKNDNCNVAAEYHDKYRIDLRR